MIDEFNIYTREAGAGGLSIAVEGPSKAEIDFKDKKDGSCQVSYRVSEPGELTMCAFHKQYMWLCCYSTLSHNIVSELPTEKLFLQYPNCLLSKSEQLRETARFNYMDISL